MSSHRTSAVVTGVFFLLAAITAVVALPLYGAALNPDYAVTAVGNDTQVYWGALFELFLAISVVGTAVTLFPIVRRQNESIALGYVAGRLAESLVIVVGILSLLAIVTLRHDPAGGAGANRPALAAVGNALLALHNWTFLFGPNLILGVNTLLLASLMYSSRLVPRFIAVLGLIGGPLIFASGTGVLFGLYGQFSAWSAIATIPVFAWEMSLAAWLIVRGFKPPIISGTRSTLNADAGYAPA